MEKKLIRFAKLHGYLTVVSMVCSEILLILFMGPGSQLMLNFTLFIILWTLNTNLVICGIIEEHARCLRLSKWGYIVLSIAKFKLFGPIIVNNVFVTLYIFCVLHFLEQLFEDLKKRKDRATIFVTTIENRSQPAATTEQSQSVLPEHNQSVSLPPSYETVVSLPNSFGQPKEFPTGT